LWSVVISQPSTPGRDCHMRSSRSSTSSAGAGGGGTVVAI
jgi:hypothetical protein